MEVKEILTTIVCINSLYGKRKVVGYLGEEISCYPRRGGSVGFDKA